MRQVLAFLVMTLVFAALAHAAAVMLAPTVIMGVAIDRVSQHGLESNRWIWRDRVTPAQRDIVQPSPDLAYGACAYDLHNGPVRIRIEPGAEYTSLSLYAENTDNFFTLNDRAMSGQPTEIVLVRRGSPPPPGAARVVESPSRTGIALERRLAPSAEAFAAADAVRRRGVCALWTPSEAGG